MDEYELRRRGKLLAQADEVLATRKLLLDSRGEAIRPLLLPLDNPGFRDKLTQLLYEHALLLKEQACK